MVGHLYGVPMVSGLLQVRIQSSSFSSSFFSQLGHATEELLFLRSWWTQKRVHPTSLKRFKSNENLPIHLTISMFPLIALVN